MQKIAILYDASQAVLSTFDLDEVLNQILAIVRAYFHLQNGCIMLLDPEKQELRVRAHFGQDRKIGSMAISLGAGITGSAVKERRPIYAPDVRKDPRYVSSIESTRSELAIPLMVRDQVVGVLDCQSDKVNFFEAETIELLTLFSTQASIALQNAKLYSLEQRRAAQLEALNAIARQTTAVLELNELLAKACSLVLQSFPVDHVAVLLLEDGELVLRAHHGKLTSRFKTGSALPALSGLCGRALDSGKSVVENNVADVPGYIPGFTETRSEMCLPLISFGHKLGVLALESARESAFNAEEETALQSLADICATAIQNAYHFERARQLAYLDGLTGIYNRRHFEQKIVEEIERANRYSGEMAVLMVDIDNFKKVNDEFGHLLGDEVLRQISSVFSQQLRKVDVVCRYGGEEFAILLPQTAGAKALAVADKLRRTVESYIFPGVARPVTITVGMAEFPGHGSTRDELVKAADAALYAAKLGGRNRVLVAPPAEAAVAPL